MKPNIQTLVNQAFQQYQSFLEEEKILFKEHNYLENIFPFEIAKNIIVFKISSIAGKKIYTFARRTSETYETQPLDHFGCVDGSASLMNLFIDEKRAKEEEDLYKCVRKEVLQLNVPTKSLESLLEEHSIPPRQAFMEDIFGIESFSLRHLARDDNRQWSEKINSIEYNGAKEYDLDKEYPLMGKMVLKDTGNIKTIMCAYILVKTMDNIESNRLNLNLHKPLGFK